MGSVGPTHTIRIGLQERAGEVSALMGMTAESLVSLSLDQAMRAVSESTDRRSDIENKQLRIAKLLGEVECDGLLATDMDNFSWLTSGATYRGILDPSSMPFVYLSHDQRWLIASNVDSQRLFDEEVDGLGFQLKEWPWHLGRDQLVSDLTFGRKVACDRPAGQFKYVRDRLLPMRWVLSAYEQACLQVIGPLVSHALEATCRTMTPGMTEREIAGQLSHRLLHRGVQPLDIEVAADGRSRRYRQCGFTSKAIRQQAVMTIVARKYGLCATASRSVVFGQPDPEFRREFDAAARVMATYVASSWPDALPQQILGAARHVYQLAGFENEWRFCPQGRVTGRAPVELTLTPKTTELLRANSAVTWHASAGAARLDDTYLVTDAGPKSMTPTEMWPLRGIRVKGAEFALPDMLQR
jgi:Xaa-Pro aminopeptidase